MKLAIMQPYLFPYLGYFQLIRAVDTFVVYDDVNYINRGWINRNNILVQGKAMLFTMELEGVSQNKLINEIIMRGRNDKLLKTIRMNYAKAPFFKQVFPLIEEILNHQDKNLSRFLFYQLQRICSYLGLSPLWIVSSELKKNTNLQAEKKILAICEELDTSHYINLAGGKNLYDQQSFEDRGIELSFIQSRSTIYTQFGKEFVPNLSIIDVMMFNSPGDINNKLIYSFDILKA
jgi:hypothetical protein